MSSHIKTRRLLVSGFRRRVKRLPSPDEIQDLLLAWFVRSSQTSDMKSAFVRAVGDVIVSSTLAELAREREREAVKTWGQLRDSGIGNIPTRRSRRTEGEQRALESIEAFNSVCFSASELREIRANARAEDVAAMIKFQRVD